MTQRVAILNSALRFSPLAYLTLARRAAPRTACHHQNQSRDINFPLTFLGYTCTAAPCLSERRTIIFSFVVSTAAPADKMTNLAPAPTPGHVCRVCVVVWGLCFANVWLQSVPSDCMFSQICVSGADCTVWLRVRRKKLISEQVREWH